MSLYDQLANVASRLLKQYGSQRTFSRTVEGEYDPSTGSVAQTASTFTAYAAVFKYRSQEVDNVNIKFADFKMLIEKSASYTPKINDTVLVFDEDFLVISVSKIQPADTTVIYECQLRLGSG